MHSGQDPSASPCIFNITAQKEATEEMKQRVSHFTVTLEKWGVKDIAQGFNNGCLAATGFDLATFQLLTLKRWISTSLARCIICPGHKL